MGRKRGYSAPNVLGFREPHTIAASSNTALQGTLRDKAAQRP